MKSVVLWNPVDLGYAAMLCAARRRRRHAEARRHLGQGRQARRAAGRQRQRDPARARRSSSPRRTSASSTSRINRRAWVARLAPSGAWRPAQPRPPAPSTTSSASKTAGGPATSGCPAQQPVTGQEVVGPPAGRVDHGHRAQAVPGIDVRLDIAEQPAAGDVAEAERARAVAVEHAAGA